MNSEFFPSHSIYHIVKRCSLFTRRRRFQDVFIVHFSCCVYCVCLPVLSKFALFSNFCSILISIDVTLMKVNVLMNEGVMTKMSPAIMKTEPNSEGIPTGLNKIKSKKHVAEKRSVKDVRVLQPHLEQQLRIASLIDSAHKEDPKLKEKLKHIVEATQKTLDEAFIALHDSDYDIDKAVTKLLEEGTPEWCVLSKKKKSKSSEASPPKESRGQVKEADSAHPDQNGDCDQTPSKPDVGGGKGGYSRGRGRGRQLGRGGRSVLGESHDSPGRRVFTNSKLEAMTREMIEANKLAEFQRVKTHAIRPVDTWDPKRPVSDLLTKGHLNDYDDEEYTGSLSKGLIITSSKFNRRQSTDKSDGVICSVESSRGKSPSSVAQCQEVEGLKEDLTFCDLKVSASNVKNDDLLHTYISPTKSPESEECISKPNLVTRAPPITASLMKAPPLPEKPPLCRPRSSSIPAPARLPAPTKIPTTPVEMPPDCDNSVELLDITFGTMDMDENNCDTIPNCVSSSEFLVNAGKPPNLEKSKHRNEKTKSSAENVRFSREMKIDSSFYEPVRHNSVSKSTQRSKSFHTSPLPSESIPDINTTRSNLPYSSSSGQSTPFTPPIPYTLNSSTAQSMSYYQNVLGAQTYTSNSHYGTSGLTSPSFSLPYPSYSSMVQGHRPPSASPSFTSELEVMTNSSSMTFPGVTTANFSIPPPSVEASSKGSQKGVPVVGHPQVILGQGMTYFQPPLYFPDMQMLQQQQRTHYYDYPGSPPRDSGFQLPPSGIHSEQAGSMVYNDSSSQQYPGVCLDQRNCKLPPFQLPLNQLVYAPPGNNVSTPSSQPRQYN